VRTLQRVRQALGLPVAAAGARVLTDDDLRAGHRVRRLFDAGLPQEEVLDFLRAVGQATSGVAVAARVLLGQSLIQAGDTELDLGRRLADVTRELGPDLGRTLEYAATAHLREQVRRDVVTRAARRSGALTPGALDVAVCFADLVGFTRLGAEIGAGELGMVAGRLASLAGDVAQEPVTLVKTIGDAAMLVSPEAGPLVDAALSLVEAADAAGDDFPQLRAGVAWGPALPRGGDWYGHTVNVASRVCDAALAGSVLATREVHDVAGDGFKWSFAGPKRLKGISERVEVYRVRREPGSGPSRRQRER
jgi:adenylate cyclase